MSEDEHARLLGQAKAEQQARFDAEMKKIQGELSSKNQAVQEQTAMISGLEDKISKMGGDLKEVRASLGQELAARAQQLAAKEQELEASQQEIQQLQRLRAQAEQEKQQFAALTARFQSMIDAGKLSVVRRDGRMMLKLPDGLLFPSGQKTLKREGREALNEVARVLKEAASDREFLVAGHTDNVPVGRKSRFRSNWELSTARATEVVKLLIEQGVPPESLAAAGYGEFDPIANNEEVDGRKQNRRLEIILLPKIEDLGLAAS